MTQAARCLLHAGVTCAEWFTYECACTAVRVRQVTFLGVSKKFTICQEAKQVNTKQNLHFECLEPHHFVPEIVETYPYEQLVSRQPGTLLPCRQGSAPPALTRMLHPPSPSLPTVQLPPQAASRLCSLNASCWHAACSWHACGCGGRPLRS